MIDDFIGIYDNAVSSDVCRGIINYFEWCHKHNRTWGRKDREIIKKDESMTLNPMHINELFFTEEQVSNIIHNFNDVFHNCYEDYVKKYSILSDFDRHTIYAYKLQRTDPGGGYHIWHCENISARYSRRIGVYILYLNTLEPEEAGETEFLYLQKRIPPREGTLLIFPAGYTHTHRGNPPFKRSKYIMTGWIEFS